MVKVEVNAGICGFVSNINCTASDIPTVLIDFTTNCPNLKPLEAELKQADGYKECFAKIGEAGMYQVFRKYCIHSACPVPCAAIKAVEVASNLALASDVTIKITKD